VRSLQKTENGDKKQNAACKDNPLIVNCDEFGNFHKIEWIIDEIKTQNSISQKDN